MAFRRTAALLLMALFVVALAAACGGGGDDDDTPPADVTSGDSGSSGSSGNSSGSGDTRPAESVASPSDFDACELLTEDEIEGVLKTLNNNQWANFEFTVTKTPTGSDDPDGNACEFLWQGTEPGGSGGAQNSFVLELMDESTYSLLVLGSSNPEVVAGLGDETKIVLGDPYMRIGSIGAAVLGGTQEFSLAILHLVEPKLHG